MKKQTLQAGALIAHPGEKVQGYLGLPANGIQIPVTLINGTHPGKTVVILSGIHGGEYPGIETTIRLAAELQPETVHGQCILVHQVNTDAFYARVSYIHPLDGKNMNRVFPGNAQGTPAEQIAYLLTSQVFSQADFLMDLHGGDLHESIIPFVAYARSSFEEITAFSKESARLMGFSYLLEANFPATTFGTAANMNVPGFIAELGQMGRWSETDISAYLSSIKNVLKSLHLIQGEVVKLAESPITLSNFTTVLSETAGCWYPCGALGDCVNQGDKIGEVRDVFSTLLKEYYAACDGIVLVLIRSLAVNVNDPLFAIGSLGDEACTNM